MDGLSDRKNVYIIAATNRPDMIDPAMLRPGRLDKTLYVDFPTPDERFEILKTLGRKSPIHPNVSLREIANDARCEGFSGADLAALIREAAVSALRRRLAKNGTMDVGKDEKIFVDMACFTSAFGKITASVGTKDKRKFEMLRRRFGNGTGDDVNEEPK